VFLEKSSMLMHVTLRDKSNGKVVVEGHIK
jgi:hypothetical protein